MSHILPLVKWFRICNNSWRGSKAEVPRVDRGLDRGHRGGSRARVPARGRAPALSQRRRLDRGQDARRDGSHLPGDEGDRRARRRARRAADDEDALGAARRTLARLDEPRDRRSGQAGPRAPRRGCPGPARPPSVADRRGSRHGRSHPRRSARGPRAVRRDAVGAGAPQARCRARPADPARRHRRRVSQLQKGGSPMPRYRNLITDSNAKWWTLGAMCFALFMLMLDNTVMNVALPSIQRDLGSSLSGLEWTINGYTLAIAVLLVTGGRLGDIFGRRRAFLVGVILFAGSSATACLAVGTGLLIASRIVQGAGAALMMPATLSIVTNAFPPEERGKAIGTWAGISALALAIGPVLGGFLTEHVSWRAIFYINVPVAAGAVIATIFAGKEPRDETVGRQVDYRGVATVTGSLTALVLALIEGNSWGWDSPAILGLLTASVALMTAFVLIERRVHAPIVEFPLFASRNFVGTSIVALVVTFAMLGQFFFIAL